MTGIVLVIGAALFIGLGALALLLWQISGNQYADMDGAAVRILLPEDSDTADTH